MANFSPATAFWIAVAAAFLAGLAVAYTVFRKERRGFMLELQSLWERLEAVFYRSPVAISLGEPDAANGTLRIIDCNDQACLLHGGSRDDVLARPASPAAATPGEMEAAKAWLAAARTLNSWRAETTLRRLDGRVVPITRLWTKVEVGGRELVLAIEQDISEQRVAEKALKESERRFRQIVETADCLLWKAHVRDGDGTLRWEFDIPRSGLRRRLFDAAKIPFQDGVLWSRFNVPELPAMNERCRVALRDGVANYGQEFRMLLPEGPTIWLQEHVEIEIVAPGEWNLVGVIVDITRLKEAQAAMRLSDERNQLVLKASNDGIWDCDMMTGRMDASERCRAMLGLSPEELPTSVDGWRERIHPEDRPIEDAAWKKYRGTGEPCVYQARFRHQDGSWRWLLVRAIAVHDAAGTLTRVVGSHTDITDLKRSDGELQQGRRLRAIGELVGGVAHEFNNLLTPMLLQTSMMRDGHAPGGTLKEQLKPVITAITEARELTQRILTFGRRNSVNPETLDLGAVVNDNLELLRRTIDRRVRITLSPPVSPLWVLQNRTDVSQIVVNLVLNARDTLLEKAAASPPAGWSASIELAVETLDRPDLLDEAVPPRTATRRWQVLTVRDNGMGMTEAVRERIFEPFYTTKEVGRGTGLGLATVWHLIKTMGGQVEVETQAGTGSVFRIFLPASNAAVARPAVAARPAALPKRGGAARILVAEDQPEVAATLTRILQRWGHTVDTAVDGLAALRILAERAEAFDVCISDINMPGASGFEVARAIRSRGLPIKIVVMGGYLTPQIRQTLEELKIEAVLSKPFALDDVAAALRTCGW